MKLLNIYNANRGAKKWHAGFTLVEILVVVGLFALLLSIGLIMGFDSVTRSTVHNERDTVVLMLTGARARALANMNESAQGVRITSDKITLFEGSDFFTDPSSHREVNRNSAISVSPEPFDAVFAQLSATTTNQTATLSDGSKTAIIDINADGRIEW